MVKTKVLLVEDDLRLSSLIQEYLEKQEYEVVVEHRGDKAVEIIDEVAPELVVLDLMLPGKDGFTVCREIRHTYKGPILILTAREDETDEVVGLELGADDYVKKPVEPRVLLARIRALLRRSGEAQTPAEKAEPKELAFGMLRMVRESRNVFLDGQNIELSSTEFELLWLLASRAGDVLDRDFLCQTIKGVPYDGVDRSIDVAVSRLRKKLADNPEQPTRIKTIWGSGYLFVRDAWEA